MKDFEFTIHAKEMLQLREIKESWVRETLFNYEFTEFVSDEEVHYIKQIKENNNRFLRIIVNPFSNPQRIITLFFDRRIKYETKGR